MTTATATWPTFDALAKVEQAFDEAGHLLDVFWISVPVHRDDSEKEIAKVLPSFAELGALTRLIANLELELHSIRSDLESLIAVRNTVSLYMPAGPEEADDAN